MVGKDPEVLKLETYSGKAHMASTEEELRIIEARAARLFFRSWYAPLRWCSRKPRIKCDPINATLDIGYTILFNYIEANLRMFGFDLYVGVFHREWFRRKSLVCDLMEPFRCVIDSEVLRSFRARDFKRNDFEERNGQFILKRDRTRLYYKSFVTSVTNYKGAIFRYVRDFYRAFMKGAPEDNYPQFLI